MKVSIVTISFNQGAFLERAILSVLEQDYPDLEYIVVDPGSTDDSRAIIERYRHRLTRVILDPDDGPADGLNHGLGAATGEIFGYLNADDRLLPGAIPRIAAEFGGDADVDVLYGHGYIEDLRRGERYRVMATAPLEPWLLACSGVVLLQQATFFRIGPVRAAGGFNPANRTCWDIELIVDLVRAGRRFRKIDADLAVFTLHGASISGSGAQQQARYHEDWNRLSSALLKRAPGRAERLLARGLRWARNPAALAARLWRMIDRRQPLPPPAAARTLR